MDIDALTLALVEKQARRTQRLSPILRQTAQAHYREGVADCLRLLKSAALADDAAVIPQQTAPLAVQPSHSAVSGPPPHHAATQDAATEEG